MHINGKRRGELVYVWSDPIEQINEHEVVKDRCIMKHKVKKRMFKIKTPKGDVVVTCDHSIIVEDENGIIKSVKPVNLCPNKHKIINIY